MEKTTENQFIVTFTCVSRFYVSFHSIDIFYNRPKPCPNALWYHDGITVANETSLGKDLFSLFVDINNAIYSIDYTYGIVRVWQDRGSSLTRNISGKFKTTQSLFAISNGDLYSNNSADHHGVKKWTLHGTNGVIVMNATAPCTDIFVDMNDTLYCSMWDNYAVIALLLNTARSIPQMVADNGIHGSSLQDLNGSVRIFVDVNYSLHVADSHNERVQLFVFGKKNVITVMGNSCPTYSPIRFSEGCGARC
jgi:hypothetical protein